MTSRARWTVVAAIAALVVAVPTVLTARGVAVDRPNDTAAAGRATADAVLTRVPPQRAVPPDPTAPVAAVYGSAVTVRPDQPRPPGGGSEAVLAAARNESASFQVDLRAAGQAIFGVRASLRGALTGPAGATIPATALALAREASYRVIQESDGEGSPGRWPDPLIPDRDPLLGGDGGAFPFSLAPGSAATIWADVAVPPDAVPGPYTGTLRIRRTGGRLVDVPIRLTVRPFGLPSTSSLRSIFLINPWDVCAHPRGHAGGYTEIARPDDGGCDPAKEGTWRVFRRFAELGLRNRISIANPYPTPRMRAPDRSRVVPTPPRRGGPTTAIEAFDVHVAPLLDGTAGQGTLPGARLTAFTTQWNCILEPGPRRNCLADWRSFLAEHAPASRARFLPWICDEPRYYGDAHQTPWGNLIGGRTTAQHAPCERLRAAARAGWPRVPTKITTPIDDPGLYPGGNVDPPSLGPAATQVLATDVTSLVTRDGGNTRPRYDDFTRRPGTELWLYLACPTAGCDPGRHDPVAVRDPAYDGWPSYTIDQPGSQASALSWMAFLYDVRGESYFDTTSGFDEGPGFQHGIESFGSNGDGQLFYPGRVRVKSRAGTRSQAMPFESIRLKRIREGREDYEYLRLLEACGRRAEALQVVTGLFGDPDHAMFQTTVDQGRLDASREALAALIVAHGCGAGGRTGATSPTRAAPGASR